MVNGRNRKARFLRRIEKLSLIRDEEKSLILFNRSAEYSPSLTERERVFATTLVGGRDRCITRDAGSIGNTSAIQNGLSRTAAYRCSPIAIGRVEEVARIQLTRIEEAIDRTVNLIAAGFGDGVDLSAEVAAILGGREQCRDSKLLYGLNRLRDEREESLTSHAYVFVIVVRTVNGEVVAARAHTIDGELSGRADASADAGTGHAALRLRGRSDARQQQR